jgi:hypothetical protein
MDDRARRHAPPNNDRDFLMRVLVYLFGVFLMVASLSSGEEVPEAFPDTVINVSGETSPISPYFLGMNESMFSRKIGTVTSWEPLIELTSQLIRELHLGHLRGPGGTSSAWYMYRNGEMLERDDPRSREYFPEEALPGHVRRHSIAEGYPGIFPHQFTRPARENGIPYVYAANLIVDSDDDLVDLAMLLRTLAPGPTFLEMGNEYYGKYATKAFPNPADYVAKVKRVRARIRELDPSIRIGALMPSPALHLRSSRFRDLHDQADGRPFAGSPAHRHLEFVDVVTRADDAYDAIVMHMPKKRLQQYWAYGADNPIPGFLEPRKSWVAPPADIPVPDRKVG